MIYFKRFFPAELFLKQAEKVIDVSKLSGENLKKFLKEKRAKNAPGAEEEKNLTREASETQKPEGDNEAKQPNNAVVEVEFMSKIKTNSNEEVVKEKSYIFNPTEMNEKRDSYNDNVTRPPLFDDEVNKENVQQKIPDSQSKHSHGSKIDNYQSRTPLTKSDVDIKSASNHNHQESNRDDSIYHFD